jgi:hypothetical protein
MKRNFLLLFIPLLGLCLHSFAQGNLMITPMRVVFEGNKQREELNIVNLGKDTTTYSISFVQKRMKEDGSFTNIEKPDTGQMFAEPFLRIFPRQVTLAPGEPQVIMLQCRRSADMLAGEYRSHLFFRSESDYKPLSIKNSVRDTTLLSVQLTPIFGMSIPIIIRSGVVNVSATLSDVKLENQQEQAPRLSLTINRTGNISIFGDLSIQYIPDQGKPLQIGEVKGVGVYTNIAKRHITIKLNYPSGKTIRNGKLKVQYVSNGETKRIVYAESDLEIK